MAATRSETMREVTNNYLQQIQQQIPDPPQIQADIIALINRDIEVENNQKPPGQKWRFINALLPNIIATIIVYLYSVVFLPCRMSSDRGTLAICQTDSGGKITYNTDETKITKIIREYRYDLSDKAIRETLAHLQDQAPRVYLDPDPSLIPSCSSSSVHGCLPKDLIVDMLLSTGELRILKSGGSSDERLIVRHYDKGIRTGIWEIINITSLDKNYGTIGSVIANLGGNVSAGTKQEILLSLRDRLKNATGGPSKILFDGFDNRLVPCRNGVYDGRDHTFTEYTDPVFLGKYGEIPFTYKLDTNYNPDALLNVPAKWDPVLGLAQLFAGNTPRAQELAGEMRAMVMNQANARAGTAARAVITDRSIGACSLRILLYMYQLAVRNYSGREGNIVFFDNIAGQAAGHNGKSTAARSEERRVGKEC